MSRRQPATLKARPAPQRRGDAWPPLCRPITDREADEMHSIRQQLQTARGGLIRFYRGMPAGEARSHLKSRKRARAQGIIPTIIDAADESRETGAVHADMTKYRSAARRQMHLWARDVCSRPGPHPKWAVEEVSRGAGVAGSQSGATATAIDWLRRHA